MRIAWLFCLFAAGCAAPLDVQSRALFASETGCPTRHTVASSTDGAVFDVVGCGLRQRYVCRVDVGCAPPTRSSRGGPSATDFPPSLIDAVPPPPPPHIETEDGS